MVPGLMTFWAESRNAPRARKIRRNRKLSAIMDQLAQVLQEIEKRRRFLVTSHARPDGDAIGSALALAQILRKMGKSAEVILRDNVPVIYKPLPHSETIIHSSRVEGDYD